MRSAILVAAAVSALAAPAMACPYRTEREASQARARLAQVKAERTMLAAKLDRLRGEPVAIAIASSADEPGIPKLVDDMAFGDREPAGSVGVVVRGASIAYPVGPLAALGGGSLRDGAGHGELAYAAFTALHVLDHLDQRRVLITVGAMDDQAANQLAEQARAVGVDVRELPSADMFVPEGAAPPARSAKESRQDSLPPPLPPDEPSSPSRWPALALLVVAAALSRRALRA